MSQLVIRSRASVLILAMACLLATAGAAKDERTLIEAKESLYNQIYVYKEHDWLLMTFGFNKALFIESAFNPKDEFELPAPYTRYMTAGLAYAKNVSSILEIGFGGGRTSWYLHRSLPEVPIVSAEIDPVVVDLSHKYFGIKGEPNFKVDNEDGRQFLTHATERYDMILLDAYHGPFVPFHMLTQEFYRLVAARLAEGGVVMQNLAPESALFDAVVKTMASVFPQMDIYPSENNAVIVAYQGAAKSKEDLARLAEARQAEYKLRYALPGLLAERRPISGVDGALDLNAKILTDDFAPAEALKAIEKHNRQWPPPSAVP